MSRRCLSLQYLQEGYLGLSPSEQSVGLRIPAASQIRTVCADLVALISVDLHEEVTSLQVLV